MYLLCCYTPAGVRGFSDAEFSEHLVRKRGRSRMLKTVNAVLLHFLPVILDRSPSHQPPAFRHLAYLQPTGCRPVTPMAKTSTTRPRVGRSLCAVSACAAWGLLFLPPSREPRCQQERQQRPVNRATREDRKIRARSLLEAATATSKCYGQRTWCCLS